MRKVRFTLAAKFLILAVILICGLLATSGDAAYDPLFTYYAVRGLSDGGLGVTDNLSKDGDAAPLLSATIEIVQ